MHALTIQVSGSGGCDLTMDADRDVTVFDAPPPPPPPPTARLSAILVGNGAGRVTSMPGGIDCLGPCSMTVQAGTKVALSAKADSSSTLRPLWRRLQRPRRVQHHRSYFWWLPALH